MKYLAFFIFAFLFYSCNHIDPNLNITKININPADSTSLFIEDIATDISTINFGRDTDRIAMPGNVFVTDNRLIITDKSLGTLFIYDKKGILKRRIEARGHAKERLLDMKDVLYDTAQKQIEILDLGTQKIFIYTPEGQFKKTIKILNPMSLGFAFAKADNIYVTTAPPGTRNPIMKRLSVYEKTDDMISFHTSQIDMLPLVNDVDINFPHVFDNYKDSIYYQPLLDDKIYRIGLNYSTPVYQITPPDANKITDKLKKESVAKDHFEYWKKAQDYKIIYETNSLFVTNKYVSFRYNYQSNKNPRTIFYSKKTGKVLQAIEFKSRKDPNFRSMSPVLAKYSDYFVIGAPNVDLKKDIPALVSADPNENTITADCKYKLMLFKLKDF
jgi:hypothetical protein